MNSPNRTLRKAVRLLIRGQLTGCINLLEPKISLFIDNADYFYLLGRSYFAAGDSENAQLYLRRGLENEPNHEEIQLMQACFAVKERDTYRAISIWLKLENAGCRRACLRYGLDQIRRINDVEELYNFTRSPKFAKLLPALPGVLRYRISRKLWRLIFLLLLLWGAWLGYSVGAPKLQKLYKDWREQREQADNISLADLDASEYFSFEKKQHLFEFSEEQLTQLTVQIRKNYDLYNDNLVQRDINKIFYSNASDKVKAKLRIIESLLGNQVEIYNLKNNFSFQEVRSNPQLYQNCFVSWRGRPTNIRIDKKGQLQFTLLVGYTDGTVLEGQVLVLLGDLISVPTDQALTVFGRIRVIDLAGPKHTTAAAKAAGQSPKTIADDIAKPGAEKQNPDQMPSELPQANARPATFYLEARTLAR